MDVGERLVELLNEVQETGVNEIPAGFGCNREYVKNEKVASHLIAHGVTAQEWISVKDRLPEKDKEVLCLLGNGEFWVAVWDHCDDGLWTDGEWWRAKNFVTHWMPLPKPPKGE